MRGKERAHWQRMEYERLMAEKRAKPAAPAAGETQIIESDDGSRKLRVGDNDAIILFRDGATHDDPHVVVCRMPEPKDGVLTIGEPFLLAWGLYWLLQNEEWKDKLIAKTKVKMSKMLKEKGLTTEGVNDE